VASGVGDSTIVTPLLQNNSPICDMHFTHTGQDRAEFLCVGTRHSAPGFAAFGPEGSKFSPATWPSLASCFELGARLHGSSLAITPT
jgi:hypothetical protein